MKIQDIFSKNLKNLLESKNKTQLELAKYIGVSNTTINNYVKGYNMPRMDKIDKICEFFNVDRSDLISPKKDIDDYPGIINIQKAIRIPIIGEIACGEPIFATQNYEGYFLGDPDIVQADFALRAEGDSMINANIHSGDLVLFRKTNQAENGKIVAVIIDDTATLKKLRKSKDTIILMPENENYDPIIISKNDHRNILIIGEMVAVLQKRSE